jgi:hypothetical protein
MELAATLAARAEPIELPLDHDEFTAYVTALRDYMHRAHTINMADWNRRMRAIDLLHAVRKELHGDNIDTACLRACNESRASVLDDQSPFPLRLAGDLNSEAAVLALDEYRWVGAVRWQPFAARMLDRIAEAVAR